MCTRAFDPHLRMFCFCAGFVRYLNLHTYIYIYRSTYASFPIYIYIVDIFVINQFIYFLIYIETCTDVLACSLACENRYCRSALGGGAAFLHVPLRVKIGLVILL